MRPLKRTDWRPHLFVAAVMLPLMLMVVGALGYHLIEGWTLFDAVYMTVTTLTTVGFREVHELSTAGRAFTMLLSLGGIYTIFFAASSVLSAIVQGDLLEFLGNRRMERSLAEIRNHIVVCGFGRMGRLVCEQLSAQHIPFVVIDRQTELFDNFGFPEGIPLHGDASSDDLLTRAGVARARALIAVVGSDAENLYITMSCRLLNDRLFIVARAEDDRSEQKLLRAGANRAVSPYMIGGARMAQAVLRPNVVDFLELATRSEHLELNIEEARLTPTSRLVGRSLDENEFSKQGLIVVALKNAQGKMVFNPPPATRLEANTVLIVLGRRPDLDVVTRLASGGDD